MRSCGALDGPLAVPGAQVEIVGTYTIEPIHGKGSHLIAQWPTVTLAGGCRVLLGSFWEHQAGRSPEEVPAYVGQQVRAAGALHPEPPREEGAQNLYAPTLYPVTRLEPAGELR